MLVSGADNGKAMHVWDRGTWNSLNLPRNFIVNQKLL